MVTPPTRPPPARIVAVLITLNEQIKTLQEQVEAHFGRHPDAEIILSQPGLGPILGARVLAEFGDAPGRYADAKARKNYAGTSPITRASGKKKVVLARFVHNDRLVDALMSPGVLRAAGLARRPRLLRQATRPRARPQRRAAPARQPARRHPARLPQDPHPLRRGDRLVTRTTKINELPLDIQAPGMSSGRAPAPSLPAGSQPKNTSASTGDPTSFFTPREASPGGIGG